LVAGGAVLFACGGGSKPVENPPTETTATAAATQDMPPPATATATATAVATAAPTATTPPPPAVKSIKEQIGEIATIDVMAKGKKKSDFKKAADVEAVLKAVGPDAQPAGELRKCPDDLELQMKAKDGKVKGHVGICNVEGLGAEFWTEGDRKGFKVADEAALRKTLKLAAPPAPKATATAAPTAAPKK
jgi:hypothetical protein